MYYMYLHFTDEEIRHHVLAYGHTTYKQQSQDSNPRGPTPDFVLLTCPLLSLKMFTGRREYIWKVQISLPITVFPLLVDNNSDLSGHKPVTSFHLAPALTGRHYYPYLAAWKHSHLLGGNGFRLSSSSPCLP